jgi:hypothetical protein
VRQRRDAHSGRYHLNQQQRVIHAFQLRAHARRLQKVAPDIQAAALHRINQQHFRRQVFRRDACFGRQRMIGCQHQAHLIIKHRRIVQAAAWKDVGRHHQVQFALLERGLRVEGDAGFKVHLYLRPLLAEVLKRGRQPLNAAMTLNGDTQFGLLRLVARLQRAGNLRQHLIRQL